MWAGPAQLTGSDSVNKWLGWANLSPTKVFFFLGVGWVKSSPTHHISELFPEQEQ